MKTDTKFYIPVSLYTCHMEPFSRDMQPTQLCQEHEKLQTSN